MRLILACSALGFALEMLPTLGGTYRYFSDEFYFVACARHPAFGYVDQPPLMPWILYLNLKLLGTSLPALRLLPALCDAALIFLAGTMARKLGGGRYAQVLASFSVLIAPTLLILCSFFSMNAFEPVLWAGITSVFITILKADRPRLWLWIGGLMGVALLNKHTSVMLGVGLAAGVVLTKARVQLRTCWPWLAVGISILLLLPNLLWQSHHGFPAVDFNRSSALNRNIPSPPLSVLFNQVTSMNPANIPIVLCGLVMLFSRRERLLPLGLAYVILLAALVFAQSSRPDRIAGMYPLLLAAGACEAERRLSALWARRALVVMLAVGGVALLPLSIAFLPPARVAKYSALLGLTPKLEQRESSPLPQWFADRFGFEEMALELQRIYRSLPPNEQTKAVILAPRYEPAGAAEFFGPALGLPPVISYHNNYYLWGLRGSSGEVAISAGVPQKDLEKLYLDVRLIGYNHCQWCSEARDLPLAIARNPRKPLRDVWSELRSYW